LATTELTHRSTPASSLNAAKRRKLLDKVSKIVKKRFYGRDSIAADWPTALAKHEMRIIEASSDEEFEVEMLALLQTLKSSHVGFFHEGLSRSSSKMVLGATYLAGNTPEGTRWIFQDVHVGAPAASAGIRPGDILISVNDRFFVPPEHPMFATNSIVRLRVLTTELREETRSVTIPAATRKRGQLPQVYPNDIVSYRPLRNNIGYLKIAMYPGQIGIEVANDISLAVKNLGPVERLIIDLRGNTGGGIGVLRAISFLTPARIPVGRYAGGKIESVREENDLDFVFDRIPQEKRDLIPLALRFFGRLMAWKSMGMQMPVAIATEQLGPMPFHGRIVLLVNRHTASANEMLVAFAREHRLATIVGEATPGRVLGGTKFSLSDGYWLALPVSSYQSDGGNPIEGSPIEPDIYAPFDPEAARSGEDTQLTCAIDVVRSL